MRIAASRCQFVLSALIVLLDVTILVPVARAQTTKSQDFLNQGHAGSRLETGGDPEVVITLTPSSAQPGNVVTLGITVKVPPGSYTYPTNRDIGGHTEIEISEAAGLTPLGDGFVADHPPKVVFEKVIGKNFQKYLDDVTWSRRYRINSDAKLDQVLVTGTLRYQVCNESSCRPLKEPFRVTLANGRAPAHARSSGSAAAKVHPFEFETIPTRKSRKGEKPDPLTLKFRLFPQNAKPGETVTLSITVTLKDDWHTFALTQNPDNYGLPTEIEIETLHGLKPIDSRFEPSKEPEIEEPLGDGKKQQVHYGEITWSRRFEVQASAGSGGFGLTGNIRYQVCRKYCLPPLPVRFVLGDVSGQPTSDAIAAGPTGAESVSPPEFQPPQRQAGGNLLMYLGFAFLGGLILNVMPCVLPVIAIKVMSFVQQAGESRGRILALNLAYSGGVILVFLMLATLAVSAGLGWGGLFRSSEFNLVMACLVFAMGLSLLGVFEIPVPGMIGSAAGAQHQEGLFGAFMTGILATVLATPCSGPFLGTTLGWSVRQPALVTFLVWGVMGFGMASPYLVFGMFPAAIKWLPKPGNWMVRLKEFAGFILMGTVIFIISILDQSYTTAVLVMLLGVGLGLWMIGNLYDINSPRKRKMTVRGLALALTVLICGFGLFLTRAGTELPWQPFSEASLDESLAKNRTVLIDFTADW